MSAPPPVPFAIADLPSLTRGGRVGFAPCPAILRRDLEQIARWGADRVVTLLSEDEIDRLGVAGLGADLQARGIGWAHLPIMDFGTPDPGFEAGWAVHGPRLRACLRDGGSVLVHCRGGLGRSGMIAARLLVELGTPPADAVAIVRAARPGAIETDAQLAHVMAQRVRDDP